MAQTKVFDWVHIAVLSADKVKETLKEQCEKQGGVFRVEQPTKDLVAYECEITLDTEPITKYYFNVWVYKDRVVAVSSYAGGKNISLAFETDLR